ncbi:ABC-type lipoprotein export system ATPase subunit [Aquimarina sp. EL_43]|uniref:TrlF family AAA-like ATPase n=1 Tax=unclassified Aquimarina TaxID=2627091 RepID=UPI0018CA4678|nr:MULTISPECIES: AAA family ATPase [unclassified Aquimarina]MBG6131629.1 ABC-type lipoprotein export system ATPase subunit [Aquimarina sp. EL_35]MBG6152090.1 ABC-type lipoprotein export system ATPase subunit [Aquimarina sp. EL_32]MBG6169966.1 ABC-type lipoprotein export system ATPase subunit [Aquimarina sp. EL_43]
MNNEYRRGSEWIKCDLHLHTPDTKLNPKGFELPEGRDKWDEYCEKIEQSDVTVFGITDYFCFDNYFKFINLFNNKFPKSKKVFFPNIEFRLDVSVNKSGEEVNLHVIFSNEDKINKKKLHDFLSKLDTNITNNGSVVSCDKLESSDDFKKAAIKYSDLKPALKKVFGNDEPYLIFAASNNQGIRADNKSARKMNISDEIDKICDGFFGGVQNIEWFLKDDRYEQNSDGSREMSKPCPVLSGCDAHSFDDLDNKLGKEFSKKDNKGQLCEFSQVTWIKIEPSWEGLKYLTYEPEERVFIGTKPEVLDRVQKNKTKYISKIEINQGEGYDESQGIWFRDQVVYPSNELTAIIGNKGKGKSAITDIAGLLGNSHNENYFSFLDVKNRKFRKNGLASNFKAKLTWQSANSEEKYLHEHIDQNAEEKVKYLPQSYFEDLCNEIDDNENFIKELNQVVFKHIDETDRLGKDSFEDFIEEVKTNCESSIKTLRDDLNDINCDIVNLLKRDTTEHKESIESKIKNLKEDLDSHITSKPVNPFSEEDKDDEKGGEDKEGGKNDENYKKLKEEEKKLQDAREVESQYLDRLEILNSDLIELKQVKFRFKEEQDRIESFRQSEIEFLKKYALNIDNIFPKPTINLVPIEQKISSLEKEKLKLQLELGKVEYTQEHSDLFETVKSLLWLKIEKIQENYELLSNSLDEKQKLIEGYNASLKDWELRKIIIEGEDENPRAGTLKYYEQEIKNIAEILPERLIEYKGIRKEIAAKIYNKKKEIVDIYSSLKKNIDNLLDENSEKIQGYRISLEASFQIKGLKANFLDYIDKGKTGYFYGVDEANRRFKDFIKDLDPNDKDGILTKVDEITSSLEYSGDQKQNPFNQIRSAKSLENLFDYIYGLEFLNEKYALKFADKDIQQLSPGERGAALIVFYLLLDNDEKPLIIDQPEDNLDNQSVFEILVPFIKQAKKHRQLIIVTHNPNLAVVADAEQIIHVDIAKENNYKFSLNTGGIENESINKEIVNILEGTMPAFDKRKIKYLKQRVSN